VECRAGANVAGLESELARILGMTETVPDLRSGRKATQPPVRASIGSLRVCIVSTRPTSSPKSP
jgi:hypothetical protein